ncbi:hypothetical protein [Egicoccus sp. AB-alg6-2]|uniref:hypothetical protein n=1 Tax=Egicoccus sp. AB-alg6-2 TaxID=3242692 RepID=UPI00359CFB31
MTSLDGDGIDLGGCGGCSFGCAVACADGRRDRAEQARRTLVASGVALFFLAVVPGLVAGAVVVQAAAIAAASCGAAVAGSAAVAVRRGRPRGDRPARFAYRVLPVAVALMVLTWAAAVVAHLTD